MKIRTATLADVPALVSLNRSTQERHAGAFPARFRSDAPDEVVARAFEDMIAAPSSCWLVAGKQEPVGFLHAEFRARDESWCQAAHPACYLAGIVVASGFRRQGIARALVDELRQQALARGVAAIDLDVWACSPDARQAFSRLGFRGIMERMTLSAEGATPEAEPPHA